MRVLVQTQTIIIAKPFFDLTKKDSKLVWTSDYKCAFDALKTALTSNQVMALPRSDAEGFILDVDACNYGIGGVLSQVQDGEEKVIAYASRSLNRAETNYCVTDKELLAIKYFVEYFRHYLLGRHFIVRSDHRPLKFLFSMKNPSGRIARWIEILSGYDFEVQYRQASRHQNADSMSRCPNPKDCSCLDTDSEETLKCGPCKKCLKRAEQMDSTLLKVEDGTSDSENVISPQVSRCSDNCYLPENVKRGVLGLLASVTKHAILLIMIFTFLFLITSDGTLLLPQLALCCGTCFALVITVKNRQSPICTVGAVLICYVSAQRSGVHWNFHRCYADFQEKNLVFLHLCNKRCEVICAYDWAAVSFGYHPVKVRSARKFVTMVRWVFKWRPAGYAGKGY